tara:strand:- start:347 stop:634 length:288 start_codon:yes stop_codon:yes gene_type:complete
MSDAIETGRDDAATAHNKVMTILHDWWRSGDAIAPDDVVFGAAAEYGWIETGRRCSWDQWPNGRYQTPGSEYVMIARLTDAGWRDLMDWMREAGK